MSALGLAGSALLFVVLVSCAPTAGPGLATAAPSGHWIVETDPAPPVAGSATGLFFEYIPAVNAGITDPIASSRFAASATCTDCNAPAVQASVARYESTKPEELYHLDATAGFSGRFTLPEAGTWRIAPFDVAITVRAVDAFEPPLVHVRRWSAPLDPGCGRPEVAALARRFEDAYNAGDATGLADVAQESLNFSIAGGAAPVITVGRDAFIAGALARHAFAERIDVSEIHVASNHGGIDLAVYATRTATDLPPGGQRLVGKAAMWCTQHQLIHLNLGAI